MPQFINADSPTSSLSTPTTNTSFEDSQSSDTSAFSYTPFPTDKINPYVDAFITNNSTTFFDGSFLTASPFEVKQEPPLYLDPFDSFADMSYAPFEFKQLQPIHRSMEIPESPAHINVPTFPRIESFERTMTTSIRPFQHTIPTFSSYTSSSEETTSDPPLPSPLPKKNQRIAKQDKGIKCDHCGVDKTPLWRKVPHKENAYHWYPLPPPN
jgi:hypothetical protein